MYEDDWGRVRSEAENTHWSLWWKRSCKWSTCQPWSQMFLDFLLFSSIFLGLVVLLNHMSSQGVFSKDIYQGTEMIYDTKAISCTIRAKYYARTTWISIKNQRSSVDSYGKKHRQVTALPHVRNAFLLLKISPISFIPPPPSPQPKIPYPYNFFYLNIPYPDRFSAFWKRLVSQETATVKYHCTTYGTFFSAIRCRHRTVSAVSLFSREAITTVFWFRFW